MWHCYLNLSPQSTARITGLERRGHRKLILMWSRKLRRPNQQMLHTTTTIGHLVLRTDFILNTYLFHRFRGSQLSL